MYIYCIAALSASWPVTAVCIHIEQGMDGEAILIAFTTNIGADCLRDVLPKLGIRLKVYNALRKELMTEVSVRFI